MRRGLTRRTTSMTRLAEHYARNGHNVEWGAFALPGFNKTMRTSESLSARLCPASLFLLDGGGRRVQLEGAVLVFKGVVRCLRPESKTDSRGVVGPREDDL